MSRPRAADDFATIRARMEQLRREREGSASDAEDGRGARRPSGDGEGERRRRERIESWPPPWVPTIFERKPRQ